MEKKIPAILDKVFSDPNCLGRRPLLEDVKRWEKWLLSVIETYGLEDPDAGRGRQTNPRMWNAIYWRALLRNLELDADSTSASGKKAPTSLEPAKEPRPRVESPAGERLRSGRPWSMEVVNDARPPPKANWGGLLSCPHPASNPPNSFSMDCEISADTSESDGLAPSITGIPAHEPEWPTEPYLRPSNCDSSGHFKWVRWALGYQATSLFQQREGAPQLHDEKRVPTIDDPHGPSKRGNEHPSDPGHMAYGLGPFIEQSEETAARKFYNVPCVFVPGEPYYITPNNHTRQLSDAGKIARGRWLLEREESGLTSGALPGDIWGRQLGTSHRRRPLLPSGVAEGGQNPISEVPNPDAPQGIAIPLALDNSFAPSNRDFSDQKLLPPLLSKILPSPSLELPPYRIYQVGSLPSPAAHIQGKTNITCGSRALRDSYQHHYLSELTESTHVAHTPYE